MCAYLTTKLFQPLSFRRILIFPKGNNVDHLSMYLDVADSASLPYGWSRYAQFSLGVINQIHNKYSVRKGSFSVFFLIIKFGLIYWQCHRLMHCDCVDICLLLKNWMHFFFSKQEEDIM